MAAALPSGGNSTFPWQGQMSKWRYDDDRDDDTAACLQMILRQRTAVSDDEGIDCDDDDEAVGDNNEPRSPSHLDPGLSHWTQISHWLPGFPLTLRRSQSHWSQISLSLVPNLHLAGPKSPSYWFQISMSLSPGLPPSGRRPLLPRENRASDRERGASCRGELKGGPL